MNIQKNINLKLRYDNKIVNLDDWESIKHCKFRDILEKYIFQPDDLLLIDGKTLLEHPSIVGKINKSKIFSKGDDIVQLLFSNSLKLDKVTKKDFLKKYPELDDNGEISKLKLSLLQNFSTDSLAKNDFYLKK